MDARGDLQRKTDLDSQILTRVVNSKSVQVHSVMAVVDALMQTSAAHERDNLDGSATGVGSSTAAGWKRSAFGGDTVARALSVCAAQKRLSVRLLQQVGSREIA